MKMSQSRLCLFLCLLLCTQSLQAADSPNYVIPSDEQGAGGGEESRSNNYRMIDTIGEPNIGPSGSANYNLRAGYRQPGGSNTFIALSGPNAVNLGTINGTGQATASGTWRVTTDNPGGYQLNWTAYAGTGTTEQTMTARWKLDETSGTTAADASGHGNTATYQGSPTVSTDLPPMDFMNARSLSFNGTTDFLSFSRLPLASGLTLSSWMKTTSNDASAGFNGNAAQNIFGDHTAAVTLGFGVQNGVARYNYQAAGWQNVTGNIIVNDGRWHHLSLTHNATTGEVRLYVDGRLDQTGNIPYDTANTGLDRIAGGYSDGSATADFFTGHLDDVRIYGAVLNDETIAQLASIKPPVPLVSEHGDTIYPFAFAETGSLAGEWKFDELSGTTAYDATANHQNGTYENGPTPNVSVPNTNLRNVRSLLFSGTDDVNLGTGVGNIAGAPFSGCAWFKTNGVNEDIVSNGAGTDGNWLLSSESGKLRGRVWYGGNSNVIDGTSTVNNNVWHHGCEVVDGSTISLYVDGTLEKSQALIGTPTGIAGTTYIGDRDGIADATNFTGSIDDVRLYTKALTALQVTGLASIPQSWSVAAADAAWGARLSSVSTDSDAKWGVNDTSDRWLDVGDGDYKIVSRFSHTTGAGSFEFLHFRSEIGPARVQPTGTYKGVIRITAVAL